MNGGPRVTIAIPFCDEERALGDAIRCVFAQTYSDWELLLVDDGSRDRSVEIAKSVQDARVRVITDGRKNKLPARLNQIVREARGELVARMDADDLIHPSRLEKEIALLDRDPGLSAIGTHIAYVTDRAAPTVWEADVQETGKGALTTSLIAHATMVARREFLLRFPYDESLVRAEDRDFFCRVFGAARFAAIAEPLYVIRPGTGDADFVDGYVRSMQQNRVIYMRHGPRLAGALHTVRAISGSLAREWIYLAVARVTGDRGIRVLVKRRGRAATPNEKRLVDEAFAAARDTIVPGLTR